MCGRYSFFDTEQLYERFDVKRGSEKLKNRYNIAPTSELPILINDGEKHVEIRRWGITPGWAKNKSTVLINARAETLDSKPTFKKMYQASRCLVPASGWYEWQRLGGTKVPHFFHRKDNEIFAFAGLFDDDEFLIITTEAIPNFRSVHERMPVVLAKKLEDNWLNPDIIEPEVLEEFMKSVPENALEQYTISNQVNKTDIDNPNLIKSITNVWWY
jgi:putative SOS response-associated peptidase YedK